MPHAAFPSVTKSASVKLRSNLNLRLFGSCVHLLTRLVLAGGEMGDSSDSSGEEEGEGAVRSVCTAVGTRLPLFLRLPVGVLLSPADALRERDLVDIRDRKRRRRESPGD